LIVTVTTSPRRARLAPPGVVGSGRPDVQYQAVFARRIRGKVLHQLDFRRLEPGQLWTRGAQPDGIAHAGPGHRLFRRHEPVGAFGRRSVGDALEGPDSVDVHPPDLPERGLDDHTLAGVGLGRGGQRQTAGLTTFTDRCRRHHHAGVSPGDEQRRALQKIAAVNDAG
jgi:hypothetical protein